MPPSISESSGIPKPKNLFAGVETTFAPLFTGQVFFMPEGLHSRDSREVTGREVWHVRAGVAARADKRQGGADSIAFSSRSLPCSLPCRAS